MTSNGENMEVDATPGSKRIKVAGRRAPVAEDTMTDVLLRLPVKSVARFRAVCRAWAALLSSDEFCALHRATAKPAAPLKMLHFSPTAWFDATAVYLRPLSPSPPCPGVDHEPLFTFDYARGNRVEVLTPAPCHGLTLLYKGTARASAYYLCNAATRAVARLPPSGNPAPADLCSTGLGFDSRTREHKVVRLVRVRGAYPPRRQQEQDTIRCEVYTPGAAGGNRWRPAASGGVPFGLRRAAASAVANADQQRMAPVFAGGFLHWLIEPRNVLTRPRCAIVLFSVADETFGCVREPYFPPPVDRPTHHLPYPPLIGVPIPQSPAGHLVAMDDKLCLVRDLRRDPYNRSLELWRLLDYASGDWSLDHCINLSQHPAGRELLDPYKTVRVIGSVDGNGGEPGEKKKMVITTSQHRVHEKFEKKVLTYDLGSQALETVLTAIEIETNTSWNSYGQQPPPSRFSIYEECMIAPVHKAEEEETALSSAPAKVVKEILLRLPARSVAQYKLVCRQWLRLIESESFLHCTLSRV